MAFKTGNPWDKLTSICLPSPLDLLRHLSFPSLGGRNFFHGGSTYLLE